MIYDKMDDCFTTLKQKITYAIAHTDTERLFATLDSISGPTLVCGVGGSSVVACFLAEVLRKKKHIIADFVYPRDLAYKDVQAYENVIAVSYSGSNIGVDVILDLPLRKYLLTGNPRDGVTNTVYQMLPETSYVSISATFVPLSLILLYYQNDTDLLNEILDAETDVSSDNDHYEVLTGYETQTAAIIFESSMIESGLGTCLLHDKYNYCHGRINVTKTISSDLVFFRMDNELEDTLFKVLNNYYKKIIIFERKYADDIINDFYLSLISLKLIRNIAHEKNIDISDMKELKDNDVLYRFAGKLK